MDTRAVPGFDVLRRVNEHRVGEWTGPGPLDADGAASGSGEIFLARRRSDGAQVAVKVYVRPVVTQRDRMRFELETAALKSLAGVPHLLAPLDAGVAYGRAYVVTAFCPSGSLHDHVVTVGRLTPGEVCRIGVKLAAGLARAHELGIYHRNVKPSNVLVDGAGQPRLADFGLVSMALAGSFVHTDDARRFAAPEAYLPELMSATADVYSLGATLYTLLAGWSLRPVRRDDPLAGMIDTDRVPDLPNVPLTLMTQIRRAVAMDPQERHQDAAELRDALAAT